jgi:hypothetical protein
MAFKHTGTAHAISPERLSNHCQGLRRTFPRFAQNLMSFPFQNRMRPDTRLQIKWRKDAVHPPSCVKFCTLTPNILWHQSRKSWIHHYTFRPNWHNWIEGTYCSIVPLFCFSFWCKIPKILYFWLFYFIVLVIHMSGMYWLILCVVHENCVII